MKTIKNNAVFTLILFMAWVRVSGLIIHVPDDYPTVQAGIDAANSGDTVLVAPGIYYGGFEISGKGITLASHYLISGDTLSIFSTNLNGSNSQRVLNVEWVTETTNIIGFTITKGYFGGIEFAAAGGAGISGSNMYIAHNRFTYNKVGNQNMWCDAYGGAIFAINSVIENNIFNFRKFIKILKIN
ncbi:MAG: hypothetical protein JXA03_16500 [Bacteroidales bacterium]|nr:hypothetical protein [Bacteroidales bacterium]